MRGSARAALLVGVPAACLAVLALSGLTKAHAAGRCGSAPTAGSHPLQIVVDGTGRTALVHIPPDIPAGRPLALVLALHGYGSNGPQMEPYSGFSRVADREGFLVAYPSSSGLYWNSTAAPRRADDVRFLGALIDRLEETMCVDSHRVFAAGVSNGGSMVALAGCELSTRISAIASVEGDYSRQPACRPAQPLSVLEIHGTADQIVPYFGRAARHTADGLPPFVNGWVARDRCAPQPTSGQVAPRARWFAWSGCSAGVRVEHVRVIGGRHQWPGATPPDPGRASTFCGACTIWRFFSQVPGATQSWGHAKQRAG